MVINSYKNCSHGLVESSSRISEGSSDDKGIASGMDSSNSDWGDNKLNARWKEFQKSAIKKERRNKDKGKELKLKSLFQISLIFCPKYNKKKSVCLDFEEIKSER